MINENKLLEISNEMRTQDNRSTRNVMFVVQSNRFVPKPDGCGDITVYVDGDDIVTEEEKEKRIKDGDNVEDDFTKRSGSHEYVTEQDCGVFFTAKACREHIESNHHHYSEPRVYGIPSWRNPEMIAVQHYILSLTGEIPESYK